MRLMSSREVTTRSSCGIIRLATVPVPAGVNGRAVSHKECAAERAPHPAPPRGGCEAGQYRVASVLGYLERSSTLAAAGYHFRHGSPRMAATLQRPGISCSRGVLVAGRVSLSCFRRFGSLRRARRATAGQDTRASRRPTIPPESRSQVSARLRAPSSSLSDLPAPRSVSSPTSTAPRAGRKQRSSDRIRLGALSPHEHPLPAWSPRRLRDGHNESDSARASSRSLSLPALLDNACGHAARHCFGPQGRLSTSAAPPAGPAHPWEGSRHDACRRAVPTLLLHDERGSESFGLPRTGRVS